MDLKFTKDENPSMDNFNKRFEAILTDETKTLYGLDAEAVPDDVFRKLSGSHYKVGDIKTTARTDLGDGWLLCNGDVVSANEISVEAAEMLGTAWNRETIANSYAADSYFMCRKWVINGDELITYGAGKETCYPQIYIASLENPLDFEVVTLENAERYLVALAYGDGKWVAVASTSYISSSTTYVYTATDLRGPWTRNSNHFPTASRGCRDICLAYGGGNWVLACQDYDNSSVLTICYTTDPTGAWSKYAFSNAATYQPVDLLYDESGLWILLSYYNNNSIIHYTYNPTTLPWTQKNNSGSYPYGLYRVNGYYVICARTPSSPYYPIIFYTDDPTSGTWTKVQLSSSVAAPIRCAAYENGQWVVGGADSENAAALFTASALDGEWTVNYLPDANNAKISAGAITDIAYIEGQCLLLGAYSTSGIVVADQSCKLPTISLDGVHTYIKVKEDGA